MISHGHGNDPYQSVRLRREGGGGNGGSQRRSLVLHGGHVRVRMGSCRGRYRNMLVSIFGPAWCLDRRSWTDLTSAAVRQFALNTGRIMATARSRWAIRQSIHPERVSSRYLSRDEVDGTRRARCGLGSGEHPVPGKIPWRSLDEEKDRPGSRRSD